MEAVLFIGLQAAGKSSFYRERFFRTHMRINLDMLKTRNREARMVSVCLETRQRFVVDNTNPAAADRVPYIAAAKNAGFRVVGYYFASKLAECQIRNEARPEAERVPLAGLLGAIGRLELPRRSEGFDELFYVRMNGTGGFVVEGWADEV